MTGPTPPPGSLDRCASERDRTDLLASLLRDRSTQVLDWCDGWALVRSTEAGPEVAWRQVNAVDSERLVLFLGRDDRGTALLAVVHEDPLQPGAVCEPPVDRADRTRGRHVGSGPQWVGLREVGAALAPRDRDAFMTTAGLARWHQTHPCCPRCGQPTRPARGGWVRTCPADGTEHFPRSDPAVIMAVTDPQDRLLVARAPAWPPRRMSVLAGFVEPGESLEAAVIREVAEEVGVVVGEVSYVASQPWPFPASLMVGYTAAATSDELRLDPDEIAQARWVRRAELQAEVATGQLLIPGPLSLARRLMEDWFGDRLRPPQESSYGRR